MILLVSGATKTVRSFIGNPAIGCLLTPRSGNSISSMDNFLWAADNAAFKNFDEKKFFLMLEKIKNQNPLFVCCPDVWGDSRETLNLFNKWNSIIKSYGLKSAFVLQDGIKIDEVPFEKIDAVFIGGSDKFREEKEIIKIVNRAKELNKWVHMGRVNTLKRIRFAHSIGCDSVDGSGFSMFPNTHIPPAVKFINELNSQLAF